MSKTVKFAQATTTVVCLFVVSACSQHPAAPSLDVQLFGQKFEQTTISRNERLFDLRFENNASCRDYSVGDNGVVDDVVPLRLVHDCEDRRLQVSGTPSSVLTFEDKETALEVAKNYCVRTLRTITSDDASVYYFPATGETPFGMWEYISLC